MPSTWNIAQRSGIEVCTSALLSRCPGLVHAFTMRGFNLSLRAGPEPHTSAARRRRLCESLGLDFARLTVAVQVHGAEVAWVDASAAGAGRDADHPPVPDADGLVTAQKGVAIMALSADCPLILACDPGGPAIGLAHAGWRGTVAGVAGRLVRRMHLAFGTHPESLFVAVAPCAGTQRYEVRDDVVRAAAARWEDHESFFHRRDGRIYMDLPAANVAQLRAAGVDASRIDTAHFCTIGDDRFCSYRRDGADTGHAALIAAITE